MGETNYVGLHGRLTQTWLKAPLIILIIMIVKLILLKSFINTFLQTAQKAVESEFDSIQKVYQIAAKAPEAAIQLANQLLTNSVTHAIEQSKKAILNSITVIESLVTFSFEMSLGTYSCLAISAVNIGANEALNATEATVKLSNKLAGDIGKEINSGLNQLSNFINGAVGLISSVESYFNEGTGQINNISLVVNKLNNLSIPATSINDKLESMRKDIPTYQGTKDFIKNEISIPFKSLKQKLNSTNVSVSLQVPLSAANTGDDLFNNAPTCNYNTVNRIFVDIKNSVNKLTIVFCVLCGVAIVLGVAYNLWHTNRNWNTMVQAAVSTAPLPSVPLDAGLEETNLSRFAYLQGNFIERLFIRNHWLSNNQIWWLRYVTMRPVVDFLIVGVSGIVISLLELAIVQTAKLALEELKKLESEITVDASKHGKMAFDMWRNQTNSNILGIQNNVNTQILGWLYNGSQTVNSTLSHFSNALNNDVSKYFNGTALYEPLQDAIACLIGNKINDAEKGLTWIHSNSQIELPTLSDNLTYLLDSKKVNDVKSTAVTIMHNGLKYLYHSIYTQLIVSGVLLGVWTCYAVGAVIYLKRRYTFGINPFNDTTPRGFDVGVTKKTTDPSAYEKFVPIEAPFVRVDKNTNFHPRRPEDIEIPARDENFDYSIMSWDHGEDSIFNYYHHDRSPSVMLSSELDTISARPNRSSIQKIQKHITQFFKGPDRNVTVESSNAPARGSIHLPDDPATPLKAMIF